MVKSTTRIFPALLVLGSAGMLSGCLPAVRPSTLAVPKVITCIDIPAGMEAHEVRGLSHVHWTTRLESGPYVAEREDASGTYYRAPPGGIEVLWRRRKETVGKPTSHFNYDGGIWVPHDSTLPPRIYTYFSTQTAAVVPVPTGASCATAIFVEDPQAKGVSLVAYSAAGALGGAAGAMVARAAVHDGAVSYGHAAGVGAAGGAVGGLIVAAIINNGVGKIIKAPLPDDPKFIAALSETIKTVVTIHPTEHASNPVHQAQQN